MNLYCTASELDRYLSAEGIVAFADHDQDGVSDSDVVADCIDQASVEIDHRILGRYNAEDVTENRMLNRWAIVMACRFLCLRRGNAPPESLEVEFQRITDLDNGFLIRIQDGRDKLRGVRLKYKNTPAFSNLTVDRRYRREKVRVTEANSNNDPTPLERDTAPELHRDG